MSMLAHRHVMGTYSTVNMTKTEDAMPSVATPLEKEEVVVEPVEEKTYTKTEINRTSTADLHKIAEEVGIKDSADMTGADLKKAIIKKLGL